MRLSDASMLWAKMAAAEGIGQDEGSARGVRDSDFQFADGGN